MIIDSWLITTDANSIPKSADALPTLATSANIVAIEVVSASVGVYSVRATLMDDALVASALLSWAVDSIGYVQQMVFSRGLVDVNAATIDPSAVVNISAASLAEIGLLGTIGIGFSGEVFTTKLFAFQGEIIAQSITAFRSDGVTPLDLSGLTLELVFESSHGNLLAVIANSDITISGAGNNVVTFFYPIEVTRNVGTKIWSLRDAADRNEVRLNGTLLVSNAAFNTQ